MVELFELKAEDIQLGSKLVDDLDLDSLDAVDETLELVDGSGDTSLTRFGKANDQVRYTEAQLKRFFSSPAAKP